MKVSRKYKEIFKLKKMLEDAKIPFDFKEGLGYSEEVKKLYPLICEHYQICYPSERNRWISVIEGFGTYGGAYDKLEIMGGLTPLELYESYKEDDDEIIGGLSAKNVFKRIKQHYENEKLLEGRK